MLSHALCRVASCFYMEKTFLLPFLWGEMNGTDFPWLLACLACDWAHVSEPFCVHSPSRNVAKSLSQQYFPPRSGPGRQNCAHGLRKPSTRKAKGQSKGATSVPPWALLESSVMLMNSFQQGPCDIKTTWPHSLFFLYLISPPLGL